MTEYSRTKINFANAQLEKTGRPMKVNREVTVSVKPRQNNSVHEIYLNKTQINRLIKNAPRGVGTCLKMSPTQLHQTKMDAGIFSAITSSLPKLIPVLTNVVEPLGLAAATGAISGASHSAVEKKVDGGVSDVPASYGTMLNQKHINNIIRFLVDEPNHEGRLIGTIFGALAPTLFSGLISGSRINQKGVIPFLPVITAFLAAKAITPSLLKSPKSGAITNKLVQNVLKYPEKSYTSADPNVQTIQS